MDHLCKELVVIVIVIINNNGGIIGKYGTTINALRVQ
jgi:predicted RNA-binding protein YlqC (UPF0109 family)